MAHFFGGGGFGDTVWVVLGPTDKLQAKGASGAQCRLLFRSSQPSQGCYGEVF